MSGLDAFLNPITQRNFKKRYNMAKNSCRDARDQILTNIAKLTQRKTQKFWLKKTIPIFLIMIKDFLL